MSEDAPRNQKRSFCLAHLFVLMSVFAAWFAAFRTSQIIGIVLGVSFIPAILCRFYVIVVRRQRKPFGREALTFSTQSCAWFIGYVLSVGPVLALTRNHRSYVSLDSAFYEPLEWLHRNTFLAEPLEWYVNFWGGP